MEIKLNFNKLMSLIITYDEFFEKITNIIGRINTSKEVTPTKSPKRKETGGGTGGTGGNPPIINTGGTFHENLVKICEHERALWKDGKIKENNPPKGHGNYQPRTTDAWSGRFISWCVQTAGKGIWGSTKPEFPSYQKHSGYSNQAKINRRDNTGYFKAYKYNETPVQVGDILVYSHDGGTWDTNGTNTSYKGHGDICTKIENNVAYCVGGNLSNSVKYVKYQLDSDNKLKVTSKLKGFYTGEGRPKGSKYDVFQTIVRFDLP